MTIENLQAHYGFTRMPLSKNIAPQNIENLLRQSPWVSHCIVVGDKRKFLGALVTLHDVESV